MNITAIQKLDELMSKRESLKSTLRYIDNLILQGLQQNGFPARWYVRNPQKEVLDYLNEKYGRNMQPSPKDLTFSLGYGEMHGQLAFVPHDVSYSWEITEQEFFAAHIFETKMQQDSLNTSQ